LSRADNTPLELRRLGEGFTLGKSGKPVRDPAINGSILGFESDPNINFEHWGEYWRKVHGVRFTHADERDDQTLERLLRYDQLHRFAPGPTNSDSPPYRAPADNDQKLLPTVLGHVEPYRRPRWDGIAYLNFATPEDIAIVLANERVQTKILPEDRAMFRDIAPVLARQYIVIPSETGAEAATLVKIHVRRQQHSRLKFQQWWRKEHADFLKLHALKQGKIKRYTQLHNIGPTQAKEPLYHPDAAKIDGVSLLGFANVSDIEDFLVSPANNSIVKHEAEMIDQAASEYWTTINLVIVNRIFPEVSSD
jgi:hypothetical protein